MEVRVKLYSTLRHYLPALRVGEYHHAQLPEGTTVGGLLESLGVPPGVTRQAFVNGETVDLAHVLSHGDEVVVFPPVAGGCTPRTACL
jgi:molybdopterin converting factor small subunit